MGKREFWKIIKMLDWSYEGDDDKVLAPAVEYLSMLSDKDIFKFENIMAELLYNLDNKELVFELYGTTDFFSGDLFLYQRCVAIANGKGYYDSILYRGRKLDPDLEFESLLYLPRRAWEKKYGENMSEYPNLPTPSYETGSNKKLWED